MVFGIITEGIKISRKRMIGITFLASGALAWFFVFFANFEPIFLNVTNDIFWVRIGKFLFLGFSALSAIVGSLISERVNRRKFLLSWVTFGVIVTAILPLIHGVFLALLFSVLLGISFGLGYPCCTAFLAGCTIIEERGRVAGMIIFETFALTCLSLILESILSLDLIMVLVLCTILRLTSFVELGADICQLEKGKEISWRTVLVNKDFAFYIFPWLMFNVASGLMAFVWLYIEGDPHIAAAIEYGTPLHYLLPCIFSIVSGILADRYGRKQPIVIGLVMLGISFGLLGVYTSPESVIIYLATSGIAWGFLIAAYITIPGDLAVAGSNERYYTLITIVPLIMMVSIPGLSDFFEISAPPNVLSPIFSIILFLSVIPVLYAKETLSQGKIDQRKLREHVKKIGKLLQNSRETKET